MRQSQLFSTTRRDIAKEEVSKNAILLAKGGYIDKELAGVYTLMPLAFRVVEKIKAIVREELNKLPHTSEMSMPVLQPHALWEESGRREKIKGVMYDLKDEPLGLGPTHEEIIIDIFRRNFSSYKDLPRAAYQIQTKFRNEPRAKSGLLRGREFLMKDLYSFHDSQEDFEQYYELAAKAYLAIFERMGLTALRTAAAGGIFSKYSDEFQVVAENGEDLIYMSSDGKTAVNKEVIENEEYTKVRESNHTKNAIEVGNIFPMGQSVSGPMNVKITGKDGQLQDIWMGCYGIGITRLVGTLVEVYGDLEKSKIVWPESVAPYKIHLVEIGEGLGVDLYKKLTDAGFEVIFDDRDISAGTKFADADLVGAPTRIVISKRTLEQDSVELTRNGHESSFVKQSDLMQKLA